MINQNCMSNLAVQFWCRHSRKCVQHLYLKETFYKASLMWAPSSQLSSPLRTFSVKATLQPPMSVCLSVWKQNPNTTFNQSFHLSIILSTIPPSPHHHTHNPHNHPHHHTHQFINTFINATIISIFYFRNF